MPNAKILMPNDARRQTTKLLCFVYLDFVTFGFDWSFKLCHWSFIELPA